jgi:sensor histidine kinase YesM
MKKHIINSIIIVVLSFAITLYFAGFEDNIESYLLDILYGSLIGLSFALGSSLLARFVLSKSDLVLYPLKTYAILLAVIITFMSINVVVVNYFWFKLTQDIGLVQLLNSNFGSKILVSEIVIGLLIFLVIVSFSFIKKLKDSQKQVLEAKQETAKFQYETLKNQINPHFLFNSLNALSALIHIDTEKADEFTNTLAQVYRYILDHQDDELVSLNEELEFIKKYAFLLKIRFDQNFDIQINNDHSSGEKMLVPMALQLLIENVFKHNIISSDRPMKLDVLVKEDSVSISNPIQAKKKTEYSHGLGIKNIEKRYGLLTEKKCFFEVVDGIYKAQIPLLKIAE